MISIIHLLTSYVTLPSLLIIFKDNEPGNISTVLFLYKLIIDKGVQDTFPNVAIALKMQAYLVLMVTNCSAERSFPNSNKWKIASEHP